MRRNTSYGNGYGHKKCPPLSSTDILNNHTSLKKSKLQPDHQLTKDKDYCLTTILNEYFTLGDKINVYAGSKQLDEQGTFLTAGSDFFIWIDSDGYVRLQIFSGGISIAQTKKRK